MLLNTPECPGWPHPRVTWPQCQRSERETLTEPALRGSSLPLSVTLLVPQPSSLDLLLSWVLMPLLLLSCLTHTPRVCHPSLLTSFWFSKETALGMPLFTLLPKPSPVVWFTF